MTVHSILEAALQYAARGWRVLPLYGLEHGVCTCKLGARCPSPGKHPAIKAGKAFENASSDQAQIGRWFRRSRRNIGLATGCGLVVVDVDGAAGLATLRGVAAALPRTLMAQSGRGVHLYFSCDGPCPTNSGGGLDIRGDGGMVVAPPSDHVCGRRYAWIHAPLASLPPDLLRFFCDRHGGRSAPDAARIALAAVPSYLQPFLSASNRLADRAAAGISSPAQVLDLEAVARTIPNADVGWDEWNRIGLAFYASSEGSDDGLKCFVQWSRQSKKFDEYNCISRWNHYATSPPDEIGFGTLVFEAKQARPDFVLPSLQLPNQPLPDNHANGVTVALPQAFVTGGIVFPDVDKSGKPKPTCPNAYKAIEGLGIRVRRDVFHDRTEIEGYAIQANPDNQLSDDVVLGVRNTILQAYGFDPLSIHVNDALLWHALQNAFHPVRDYLASLEWDGVGRLEGWLNRYLGASASPLNGQFGKLILLAAVRRIREPGAKFDEILVLEGPEGQRKSSAIRILAGPDNFADQPILTLSDRAQQEALRGVWLYEIADLTGISRADVDKVKAFASRQEDRARPAYGRHRVDLKRQCVFFGTTNTKRYLQSQTGNRRWWPVECGQIDLAGLKQDRDQIWAEAVALDKAGHDVRLAAEFWQPAATLQEERAEIDPWLGILSEIGEARLSTVEIFERYLRMTPDKLQMHHSKRLAYVMAKLGWDGPKPIRMKDKVVKGYSRGAEQL